MVVFVLKQEVDSDVSAAPTTGSLQVYVTGCLEPQKENCVPPDACGPLLAGKRDFFDIVVYFCF